MKRYDADSMNLLFLSCGASPTARKWTITFKLSGTPSKRDVRLLLLLLPGVGGVAVEEVEAVGGAAAVVSSVCGGAESAVTVEVVVVCGGLDEVVGAVADGAVVVSGARLALSAACIWLLVWDGSASDMADE